MKLTAPKYLTAMGIVDKDGAAIYKCQNFNPLGA
jgi:hypothetical protein